MTRFQFLVVLTLVQGVMQAGIFALCPITHAFAMIPLNFITTIAASGLVAFAVGLGIIPNPTGGHHG